MVAIGDVDAALEILDRAVLDAEACEAPLVADVALGYRANHLALAGRGASARAVLDELDARCDSDEYTYGRHLHLSVSMSVNIVSDPGDAYHATNQILERDDRLAHLTAAPAATSGHLADALRRFERAIERRGMLYPDDGLPDLLIPVAAAAYAVSEHDRCRTLLAAVRNAPKPTQTFMSTIQYRELRNAVGLDAENPLNSQPIEEIFEDACTWFREMISEGAP